MAELVGGWFAGKLLGDVLFWAMGALVFRYLCLKPVVKVLHEIDDSLRCMPAARAMRAAAYRKHGRAA